MNYHCLKSNQIFEKKFFSLCLKLKPDSAFENNRTHKIYILENIVSEKSKLMQKLFYQKEYVLCANFKDPKIKIWVVEPDIKALASSKSLKVPHVYDDNSLCLYHPNDYCFNSDYDVEKIFLWAHQWLFYFENYLMTRKWNGLEAKHNAPNNPSSNTSARGIKKENELLKNPIRLKNPLHIKSLCIK